MKSKSTYHATILSFMAFGAFFLTLQNLSAVVDPRALTELDIVPMPKEIILTDRNLELTSNKVVVIVGTNKCRQAEIGADWINQHLAKLKGQPLPVLTTGPFPSSCVAVIIGTRKDNPLIEEAARSGIVSVDADSPGPRGYEIRTSQDGQRIYLAGADEIGALYACVTFTELIQKMDNTIVWRGADVRDWPDIIHMTMGGPFVGNTFSAEISYLFSAIRHNEKPNDKLREKYLNAMHTLHDWMLRRKITSMGYALGHLHGRRITPQDGDGGEVIREGIKYGRERGIGALVFAVNPFVGRAKFYPELKDQALPPGRYPDWIRSWSMDDARKETADNLAQLMRHFGITDLAFHDTDAGGVKNPAQWNDRPEADKQRWGDDYAAATAHIHGQYYDAIRAIDPEMRLHFTIYPYVVEVLDEETGEWYLRQPYAGGATGPGVRELAIANKARYEVFWKRLHEMLPTDVSFCVRETKSVPMGKFRAITEGRPAFIFFGLQSPSFLAEYARSAGMFYHNHDDFIFLTFADKFVPLNSLTVREYSWNSAAPGAAPFAEPAPTRDLHTVILPRIIRNLFGRSAASEIYAAVSEPITPDKLDAIKDLPGLQEQAAMAERGAQALDKAWEKIIAKNNHPGMDNFALRRFINLREVYHTSRWRAQIRAKIFLARELALKQDEEAAMAAIQDGINLLGQARFDLEQLIKDRPEDPVLDRNDKNRWSGGWRAHMADRVDFDAMEKPLIQTQSELKEFVSRGAVPTEVADRFAGGRDIRVVPTADPITVNGRLDEPAWSSAFPVECFFIHGADKIIARADTRARLLCDTNALYIGFNAWTPMTQFLADTDTLELFLCAPGLKKDYVHFMISAGGRIRQQYNRVEQVGSVEQYVQDNDWQCPGLEHAVHKGTNRWDLELKIPLTALASQPGAGWSANLLRLCPLTSGSEVSMILPPGTESAHAIEQFAPLLWESKATHMPTCAIEAKKIESRSVTMRDRITDEVCFELELNANQLLHNVSVRAEFSDHTDKICAETVLLSLPCLYYHWQSKDAFKVTLSEECKNASLRILVASDEGAFERTVRVDDRPEK